MKWLASACLAIFLGGPRARADKPGFEAIPPAAWQVKLQDTEGTGALVLERRIELNDQRFEFFYRIRILSEAGKTATSVLHLPTTAQELWGRTVTKEGQEFVFTDAKDLFTKTLLVAQGMKAETNVVVPPGVTTDCVVEIHWVEPQPAPDENGGQLGWRDSRSWPLALAYPIQHQLITLPERFSYAWNLKGRGLVAEPTAEKGKRRFTCSKIAALPEVPYTLEATRNIPRLTLHDVPVDLREAAMSDAPQFWQAAGTRYFKPFFRQGIESTSRFRSFAATLLKELPKEPQRAASELAMRLEANIQNTDQLTYQEAARLSKEATHEVHHYRNLDESVRRGRTDHLGMIFLYLQLLQEVKLKSKVLLVADRDVRLLDPQVRSLGQHTNLLLGVEEEGKDTMWVDLGMRYAPPGLLNPDYQGTQGIAYDTSTWVPEFLSLPVQPAERNRKSYSYRVSLDEDTDSFQLDGVFEGYPEYLQRARYMALDPAGQGRKLRELVEFGRNSIQIDKAEVLHAGDPREKVTWHLEGRLLREASRRREVVPFPALPWPLSMPDSWPPGRTDPITLPYLGTQVATCGFQIPAGYRLAPVEPLSKSNRFGKVTWSAEVVEGPQGSEVRATFQVEITSATGRATDYGDLQAYLGWIRTAMERTLVLEKVN